MHGIDRGTLLGVGRYKVQPSEDTPSSPLKNSTISIIKRKSELSKPLLFFVCRISWGRTLKMAKSCLVLVAVAMALCMAAGASAQGLQCRTDDKSPLLEDAQQAFGDAGGASPVFCLVEGDCTVVSEYKTAQLKICGEPGACVPYYVVLPVFRVLLTDCARGGKDGTSRIAGELSDFGFNFVIKGQDQNANVAIEMKLSE
jgi:hypothetical protein